MFGLAKTTSASLNAQSTFWKPHENCKAYLQNPIIVVILISENCHSLPRTAISQDCGSKNVGGNILEM